MFKLLKFALPLLFPLGLLAQTDPPIIEEEDDSETVDYSNLVQTTKNKAFCSSKVIGQSPLKLVSLGYDFQTGHSLTPESYNGIASEKHRIANVHGARFGINYPVFSKNYFVLNLGVNYSESNYNFFTPTNAGDNLLAQSLDNIGSRSIGFTATGFKPLNAKHWLIFQAGANLNGDYTFADFQSLNYTRVSAAAIFGFKPSDRKMWGFGVSRSYLGGAFNYVPVYYMIYTAQNKKWGLEMLLPARFNYRRSFTKKNILLLGYEVEGNSFRINNDGNKYGVPMAINDIELRRAELRIRATWEKAITNQIWVSAQVGYRYNWAFDVDNGDFFRPFGDDTPFLFETELTNPAYVNVSINWVSPN